MNKRSFKKLLIIFISTVAYAQPKQVNPSGLISRLAAFGKTIPQEKVFVHMDNTSYFLGDTIWFSAYTRQTNTDTPSKVSGVLYAELYNNDGYLVERKLIEMKGGRGNGFFALREISCTVGSMSCGPIPAGNSTGAFMSIIIAGRPVNGS